jgi:hypothetical protein
MTEVTTNVKMTRNTKMRMMREMALLDNGGSDDDAGDHGAGLICRGIL